MTLPSGFSTQAKPLPLFRTDLEVFQGPDEPDGSSTYNIFDPIQNKYFKISWAEAVLLLSIKPGMTLYDLVSHVNKTTTLQVSAQEVGAFINDAINKNLTLAGKSSDELLSQKEKGKVSPLRWLIYHYLYFRIPLFNPDEFLKKSLPSVKPLLSKLALKIYAAIVLLGFFLLLMRFDDFIHTFTYFFDFTGFTAYILGITCVKIFHELGHAYTAKNYGVRVSAIGIAFIVFWPVLFTDITDAWRLSKRYQRLAISVAGICVELLLAGISTLGWAITEPGILHSIFFIIASATWISTLVINLNPAMRWDGYFLLSDLLGMDNLQPRAFELTRWRLRKWLLGLDVPPPEDYPRKKEVTLIIYTFYTWIYRLFLYTAIAIVIYVKFTKALGIFLFLLEIGIFIIGPFVTEARRVMKLKKFMKLNPRMVVTLCVLALLLGYFILPWPHQSAYPAVVEHYNEQVIYASQEGLIDEIYVKKGQEIKKGDKILCLVSDKLNSDIADQKVAIEIVQKQIEILTHSTGSEGFLKAKKEELLSLQSKLKGLIEQQNRNCIVAIIDGKIYDFDDKLTEGQYLQRGKEIGRIANLKEGKVIFFVPEKDVDHVEIGQKAWYKPGPTDGKIEGRVLAISPSKVNFLQYPQLASIYHGPIPVTTGKKDNKLQMVQSYYTVDVYLTEPAPLKQGEVGSGYLPGMWSSLFVDGLRRIQSLILQEGNF